MNCVCGRAIASNNTDYPTLKLLFFYSNKSECLVTIFVTRTSKLHTHALHLISQFILYFHLRISIFFMLPSDDFV